MRTLIIVKKGEQITNRDVTGLESLEVEAVVAELKIANPGPEPQWFKHTCGETGCSEKEFAPKVITMPAPAPTPEPELEPTQEPEPKLKSKKKK